MRKHAVAQLCSEGRGQERRGGGVIHVHRPHKHSRWPDICHSALHLTSFATHSHTTVTRPCSGYQGMTAARSTRWKWTHHHPEPFHLPLDTGATPLSCWENKMLRLVKSSKKEGSCQDCLTSDKDSDGLAFLGLVRPHHIRRRSPSHRPLHNQEAVKLGQAGGKAGN